MINLFQKFSFLFVICTGSLRASCSAYSASLFPVQSVGVQGDGRTYSFVFSLLGFQKLDLTFSLIEHATNIGFFLIAAMAY